MENWNKADKDGNIDVPDYLMPLLDKIGMQLRLHTISGKNEIQTVCDIVYLAEKFFTELTAKKKNKRSCDTPLEIQSPLYMFTFWFVPLFIT